MKKLSAIASSLTLAGVVAVLPLAAFAQTTSVGVTASVDTPATSATVATKGTFSVSTAISRADAEIERRITNLNSLATRISSMKNVSATEKTSLQTSITSQINAMTSLKATIDATTVASTLKTEIQSITEDYRIYMLVLPQGRIAAASDRVMTIVSDMQTLAPKLQARITAAQNAGNNMSAATAAYADMQTQITNANAAATAAINTTANLTPDQGNTTVEASNTAAIKAAAAQLQTATADLKAARADIQTIINAVKGKTGASATATTSAQ